MSTAPDDYLALWWHGECRLPEDELIAWAGRQRLLPLLGWRAEEQSRQLPEALTEAIRRARMIVAVRQTLADQQLRALGATADRLGIPLVLVKGAAAAAAYPEPWMRPYGDIDLLIDEADIRRFLASLTAQGYAPTRWAEGRQTRHYPPLVPPTRGVHVEVHTAMGRERGRILFTSDQWERAFRPSDAYPGLHLPGPHDHVLYLIYHAIIHHDLAMGLQPYADMGFHTQAWTASDWHTLAEMAADLGIERALRLALALTRWFWQAEGEVTLPNLEPPETEISELAKSVAVGTQAQTWVPHLWRDSPDYSLAGLATWVRKVLLGDPAQLQAYTRRERLRFHLQRPFKLVQNHGTSIWRLLRGDPAARAAWRTQRDLQTWLREG